jgi:hypothetical protein
MATVTPNFNWPVPTSTDLVKDGATAIEALGDSIDASLVDLKGGTTGQVLSKTSNTDMDFSWVAQDDSNAIQNSIINAKGDLIVGTANDTPGILSVSQNGDTIVADSSTSTGLRYQEPLNLNPILNSGFDIWQRGTASTAIGSGTFLADRWQAARAGFAAGASQSRQVTGDTTNLPNIQYCLRVQRDSGTTGTGYITTGQNIETINSIPYAGKTVTLSFYARAGANFSATSSILGAELASGTGTDQNLVTAGTLTGIDRTTENKTLTTTWQRFTITKAVASTATQLCMQFYFTPTGTAGASDYFEITGVMINIGSAAYPFRRTTGTIQGELAAASRYFYLHALPVPNAPIGMGTYSIASALYVMVTLPVQMRTTPTIFAGTGTNAYTTIAGDGFNTLAIDQGSPTQIELYNNTQVSGTGGQSNPVRINTTSGYLGFSAEL